MGEAVVFALIASAALPLGAAIGVWAAPPRRVTAALLAFASGALITAVAFELFEDAFHADEWRAGVAFAAGAAVFVVVDGWLERRTARRGATGAGIGFALLAGVTLDGVPENLALGVSLIEGSAAALLVAIFVSNLPEAIVGAKKMREADIAPGQVMGIWVGAAILLAIAVVVGYGTPGGRRQGARLAAGVRRRRRSGIARRHADAGGVQGGGRAVDRLCDGPRLPRVLPDLGRLAAARLLDAVALGDVGLGVLGRAHVGAPLTRRKLDIVVGDLAVGDLVEQMGDQVEPRGPLVV